MACVFCICSDYIKRIAMDETADRQQKTKTFNSKVWIAIGITALAVVLLLLFRALFSVILLTFAGLMIGIYFLGFADLLKRYLHLSQSLAVIISVLFNLLLLVGFFWFVGGRLSSQISSLSDTLPQTIEQAKATLSQSAFGQKVVDQLQSAGSSEKTRQLARRLFSSTYGVVSDLYIVLLIGLFFTASPSLYKRGIIHLLPENAKDKGNELLGKLYTVLKKWLKGQIIGVFFIGILTAIGLIIVGMPLVLTLSLIAGLMNFIPNFGPIIALIPALLLAFMQGTNTVLIVLGIYVGIQILQTAIMQPLVQKKMVSIPPALIIISQITMGSLAGFWGVLLATPTVAVLMTIINDLYVKRQTYHEYKVK
jgi:predicted PurR-regulated permease PerM